MGMKLFRCRQCRLTWKEKQLVEHRCPQDGGRVYDVSKTKVGKALIKIYEREEKEGKSS
jgi:hypothetical protein